MNTTTTKIAGEAMQITDEQIDKLIREYRLNGTDSVAMFNFARALLESKPAVPQVAPSNEDAALIERLQLLASGDGVLIKSAFALTTIGRAIQRLAAVSTAPAQSCGDAEQADAPQAESHVVFITDRSQSIDDVLPQDRRWVISKAIGLVAGYRNCKASETKEAMQEFVDYLRSALADAAVPCASEQADEAVTDAASDLAFSVYSGLNALRWLLNLTTEFDRKDVRTRQAARLLDDYTDSFGKTNRQRLEDLWKKLYDKLPDDGRINEYLRAHDAASRELKARAKDSK
jgi:hypothetical protein